MRLTGCDGKIKGRLNPRQAGEILTVRALCNIYGLDLVMDLERRTIPPGETVIFREPGKAVFWDNKRAVYLTEDETGQAGWRMLGKKELPKRLVN